MGETTGGSLRSGVMFGMVAYMSWGVVPLYFHQINQVPALEILAHRIVWSIVVLLAVCTVFRLWPDLIRVLGNRKLVLMLASGSLFLAANWLLYIYATVTHRVTEAGLGYFMMPLVNAALAMTFLGERLRPAHYPALVLVALGVAVPFLWTGSFTWIAVALPVTFGFYSLIRKQVPVGGLTGLAVETVILLIPSVAYLLIEGAAGRGSYGTENTNLSLLLMLSGIVTVIPLAAFAISVRRMPLIANSFIQFVSPTMQLLIALVWIGEEIPPERWAAIVFVWVAVAIFLADATWKVLRSPKPVDRVEAIVEAVDQPVTASGVPRVGVAMARCS
ncbi:MAG: EamA family transporter RarD [Bacteroidales bacterium]|nr:EamA family transporter RarD [Bacteroidales bacterium]